MLLLFLSWSLGTALPPSTVRRVRVHPGAQMHLVWEECEEGGLCHHSALTTSAQEGGPGDPGSASWEAF